MGGDAAVKCVPRIQNFSAAKELAQDEAIETVLKDFVDFWGSEDGTESPKTDLVECSENFSLQTPRELQIFSLSTPREAKEATRASSYVPHWPFWSRCRAPTTLYLENLPRGCCPEAIVGQLDAWGFAGRYNFVKCPSNPCTGKFQGCAVINAVRHADACALSGFLHNFSDWGEPCHKSRKSCKVSWSLTHQGLEELILDQQHSGAGGAWLLMGDQWTVMPQIVYWWPAYECQEWDGNQEWPSQYDEWSAQH